MVLYYIISFFSLFYLQIVCSYSQKLLNLPASSR